MPASALLIGRPRFRVDCQLLIFLGLLLGGIVSDSLAAAKFVSGLVPDWNQPYRYVNPNGPGPDPNRPNPPNQFAPHDQWNDWCAPSSGANLAGHWADVLGKPVADTTAFPGTTVAWGVGPSWHDYQADSNRPPAQVAAGALPSVTTDIGWYMDCNRNVPYDDGTPKVMGGYFFGDLQHPGTLLRNMHVGLQNFLNDRYGLSHGIYWRTGTRGVGYFAGVSPGGAPNVAVFPNEATAFAEVMSEIDSNRTLILSFSHWSIVKMAQGVPQSGTLTNESAFGYTNYNFSSTVYSHMPNAEDEYWNLYDNDMTLGHAVTCVGYMTGGDPSNPIPGTDWVIVHDNWSTTPRNVAVPYGTGGQFNPYWVANTTAVPGQSEAKFLTCLVPDWNQPYTYGPVPNGPTDPNPGVPGAVNQWNAWCAPSSAANLAGHWADCFAAPVADTTAFPGSTVIWGAAPSWQDYLADGTTNRPALQVAPGALPVNPTDIGWYMDTNRGQLLDGGGGLMGGLFLNPAIDVHVGTYLKDIHAGLGAYLTTRFGPPGGSGWDTGTRGKGWAAGIDTLGNPAQIHLSEASAFTEVMSEINRNHPLILCFSHWAIQPTAFSIAASGTSTEMEYGGTYYAWPDQAPNPGDPNAEDELWNFHDYTDATNNLGHAVTCVGYIPANDPADPIGGTDWVVVHDNWASTPRNVIIPFDWVNWRANTTAEPSPHLSITNIHVVVTNIFISFTGIPSALHHLEWKSDMTNSTWTTCVSNMAFVAGTMQVTNSVPPETQQRFYRIGASY